MSRSRALVVALLSGLPACAHTDSFAAPVVPALGPFATGADVQLTFNVDQDYWPTWTDDGRGILYAYVDRERPLHRCIGLLPAAGGTRLWQLCDNRAVRDDSASSYGGFALDSAGQLLVAETVSSASAGALSHTSLWLADTAHPYLRTSLLTLPVTVGTTVVNWLADISWTGPNTFIALGQQFGSLPHCVGPGIVTFDDVCPGRDSVWADSGGLVVRGTIAANRATLQPIAGTNGATAYSLAENGASIVFTLTHDLRLFTVLSTGGMPVPTPNPAAVDTFARQVGELAGVSCRGTSCIVARDRILIAGDYWAFNPRAGAIVPQGYPAQFLTADVGIPHPMEIHSVSLTTGADQLLLQNNAVYVTPRISPTSGDLVVQVGGGWGHLQTFATAATGDLSATDGNSVLHLLKGIGALAHHGTIRPRRAAPFAGPHPPAGGRRSEYSSGRRLSRGTARCPPPAEVPRRRVPRDRSTRFQC